MTSRSGFSAGRSETRAERMEVAAEPQRVFSVKRLTMPMPETMRLTGVPLRERTV